MLGELSGDVLEALEHQNERARSALEAKPFSMRLQHVAALHALLAHARHISRAEALRTRRNMP